MEEEIVRFSSGEIVGGRRSVCVFLLFSLLLPSCSRHGSYLLVRESLQPQLVHVIVSLPLLSR